MPCPTALLQISGLLTTSGRNGKKWRKNRRICLPSLFCLDSIRQATLGHPISVAAQTGASWWFKQMSEYTWQGPKNNSSLSHNNPAAVSLSACIQACRNTLRQSTRFCTVPALEAKLGCLGFLVRRTLRTLSVISSTWAWTLLKQMSDSGLQYWSIKTAPAKNKLYKKQDFSVFPLLSFSSSKS